MDDTPTRIRLRGDSSENWQQVNPILGLREPAYDETTRQLKVGDGQTPWNELPYVCAPGEYPPTVVNEHDTLVFTE
jgi:hypothetical protein